MSNLNSILNNCLGSAEAQPKPDRDNLFDAKNGREKSQCLKGFGLLFQAAFQSLFWLLQITRRAVREKPMIVRFQVILSILFIFKLNS
jgi:hypothetical protein